MAGDVGRGEGDVHRAEAKHPSPRNRPVRQQPVVGQTVEDQRPEVHEHVEQQMRIWKLKTLVAGPVDRQEEDHEQEEPPSPDRDPHRVVHHVRVGADERLQSSSYGIQVLHLYIRCPGGLRGPRTRSAYRRRAGAIGGP